MVIPQVERELRAVLGERQKYVGLKSLYLGIPDPENEFRAFDSGERVGSDELQIVPGDGKFSQLFREGVVQLIGQLLLHHLDLDDAQWQTAEELTQPEVEHVGPGLRA